MKFLLHHWIFADIFLQQDLPWLYLNILFIHIFNEGCIYFVRQILMEQIRTKKLYILNELYEQSSYNLFIK
jgi:hypothetical protein